MSKYNTPPDFLEQFAALKKRVERLERFTTKASVATQPVTATGYNAPVAVTSGTFTTTHLFLGVYSAPTPVARILITCTDGTTSGEFRLADVSGNALTDINGNAVAPEVIPLGTTIETAFENTHDPNYADNLPIGSDRVIQLQVRRTAGAGTLNVKAKYLIQIPS